MELFKIPLTNDKIKTDNLPIKCNSKIVKLYKNFIIELDMSLNCIDYWIKSLDQNYLKIINYKRLNGPQIGSFLDKSLIELKPIKKGEIEISLVEVNCKGPYRELNYNIKIID